MGRSAMNHPRVRRFNDSIAPDFCVASAICNGDEVVLEIKLLSDKESDSPGDTPCVVVANLRTLGPPSERLRKWLCDFFFENDPWTDDGSVADSADWWKT
jgi:hypothetical protein